MENDFWLNLASRDLKKSKEFFSKMGFTINQRHSGAEMLSLEIGSKKIILNLFPEAMMQNFMSQPVTDAQRSNEVLFSIGAQSPAEVDALAKRAEDAGAHLFGKPGYKDGWLYGCGFADVDGHRWNILYMDMSKIPQK